MVKLLHVSIDDKFFDSVYLNFEKDKRIENTAICIVDKRFNGFKYIKNTTVISPLKKKNDIIEYLQNTNYDIVYFHSFPVSNWWIINYIPSDKIIIWWAWGYDLYYKWRGCPPHIKVKLFKHITKTVVNKSSNIFIDNIKSIISDYIIGPFFYRRYCKKVMKRIDYFQPVLHLEYELMKNKEGFRAKEFYNQISPLPIFENNKKKDFIKNNILIGNSATPSNNHLDIINLLNKHGVDLNRIIIPLNYGDKIYLHNLIRVLKNEYKGITIIEDFMSQESYFSLLSSCTHSIIGVMRQQAMGNIYQLLRNGTKVFLYKDSIPYQYLTSIGYLVYAIEDITVESLSISLSVSEIEHNRQVLLKEILQKNLVYDVSMKEIIHNIKVEKSRKHHNKYIARNQ